MIKRNKKMRNQILTICLFGLVLFANKSFCSNRDIAVVSPIAAGAGHVAGGTTYNLLFDGQNLGNAFNNSFQGIGKSMVIGGSIGVAATVGVSYANGINPISGKMMWPKNDGFQGNPEYATLKKGTMLDRYGDDTGQFLAPKGTPFDQRTLPPNYVNKQLSIYEVTRPLPVLQGTAAPSFWFNASGGGTQYMLPIQYYLNKGYLIIRIVVIAAIMQQNRK